MIKTARRIQDIEEYYFAGKLREISKRISEGSEIINLGIGSPDLPPHPQVLQSLKDELDKSHSHGYQPYKGIADLRLAFSRWCKEKFNTNLSSDTNVLPLIGSKEGVMHISMSFVNSDDVVLVPNPGYPTYASAAKIAGADVYSYQLNGAHPDLESIPSEVLKRTKMMWINYPHMPTGVTASKDILEEIVKFAKTHNILLCHDNPYNQILSTQPISIFQIEGAWDIGLELQSMSKSFNMAGWRVGFLSGKKEFLDSVQKFKSNMDSGMFKPIQVAAIKAFETGDEHLAKINAIYKKRKLVGIEILQSLACTIQPDQAGMFLWARIPGNWKNAEIYSDYILDKFGIFITPGHVFGTAGKDYLRLSLCSPENILLKSLDRIKHS